MCWSSGLGSGFGWAGCVPDALVGLALLLLLEQDAAVHQLFILLLLALLVGLLLLKEALVLLVLEGSLLCWRRGLRSLRGCGAMRPAMRLRWRLLR